MEYNPLLKNYGIFGEWGGVKVNHLEWCNLDTKRQILHVFLLCADASFETLCMCFNPNKHRSQVISKGPGGLLDVPKKE